MAFLHFEQEMYHTYLVLDVGEDTDRDRYGIKILQNNTLGFFLPFELRSQDQTERYYYDIPSEESLKKHLEKGISQKQIEIFAASLLGALDEVDEYLMDENQVFLDPESIYWSSDERYLFTYYPGYKGDVPGQLKDIAALFLKAVDYTSADAVQRVYEFYHLACNESTSLKKLREYVLNTYKKDGEESCGKIREKPEVVNDTVKDINAKNGGNSFGYTDVVSDPLKGAVNDFCSAKEAEILGELPVKAAENVQEEEGRLWDNKHILFPVVMGIVCLIELGIGGVCLKVFNTVSPLGIIVGTLCFMVISVMAGVLWVMFRKNSKEKDDFWKPEDYIPCNFGSQLHETTILKGREPEIALKSSNPQLCGHLYISNFPAIIGKEVSDARCKISVPTISRRHARLEYRGKDFYLTDLCSSNGTFINGELIPSMKPMKICSGDDIIFSDLEFTFEILEVKE